MKKFSNLYKIALLTVLFSLNAFAVKFSNQFIEFELPVNWKCGLEGTEWVCQSKDDGNRRDAIIILAAKLKGPQDTLDQYAAYLKAPRNYTTPTGQTVASKSTYVNYTTINEHSWVDSLHDQSELPGFNTRYLATIKADIGVLVTYSVKKEKWQQYQPQFDLMVKSLKVFRTNKAINVGPSTGNLMNAGSDATQQNLDAPLFAPPVDKKKQMQQTGGAGLLLIILIGAIAFIIIKRRKNNK